MTSPGKCRGEEASETPVKCSDHSSGLGETFSSWLVGKTLVILLPRGSKCEILKNMGVAFLPCTAQGQASIATTEEVGHRDSPKRLPLASCLFSIPAVTASQKVELDGVHGRPGLQVALPPCSQWERPVEMDKTSLTGQASLWTHPSPSSLLF